MVAKQLQIPGTGKLGRPKIRSEAEIRDQVKKRAKRLRARRKRHLEALERLRRVVAGYLHAIGDEKAREHVLERLEQCKETEAGR